MLIIIIISVTAAEISEDSSLLATGFSDSGIKVWSLVPSKLRLMKTGEQLQDIDREAGKMKLKWGESSYKTAVCQFIVYCV